MSESLNLLVVEDDDSLRDALQITLEAAGHRVAAVDGGPAALAALARETFSMVVSDLRMDPMDGLTLLAEVKERYPETVRLALSAYTHTAQLIPCINTGHL